MTQRWQRKKTPVGHADDWLMTYADLITLLLCFFAIVMMTAVAKKSVAPQAPVQQLVEQREQIPPPLPQMPAPPPSPATFDIFPGNLPFHNVGADPAPEYPPDPPAARTDQAPEAAAPAPATTAPVPAPPIAKIADAPKPQAPPAFAPKGDRISSLEINSAAFFTSGSADLSEQGKNILRGVAASLKSDRLKDYNITVEGHTDDTPIHTAQFPSNWELSTARASAVARFFLDQGLPATRLRAAGYADTFPKAPNRDSQGNPIEANRAENRRVVIKLEKIEKE
ncbi:MAG: OmpA family protein [Alphaproteobacteria bacterium]|nr:OmpA family protein [Alphaproteobacteria bacterium]